MKKTLSIFGLLFSTTLIMVSCKEEMRELQVGDYTTTFYDKGEKWGEGDDVYSGIISNDTLRLIHNSMSYRSQGYYDPSSCAGDTLSYYWYQYLIPLKVKHTNAILNTKSVRSRGVKPSVDYFIGIDTCIRLSNQEVFNVTMREDVIEIMECPEDNQDCEPHEGWVVLLTRIN